MSYWSMDYPFASRHKGPRFKSPGGYLCETGILLLALSHYIGDPDVILITGFRCPSEGASLGFAPTLCKPTWSHKALLSLFHARCWSSFQLHNQQSRLVGGSPVESLQSPFIHTMCHWSSGLPVCFPSQGTWVQIPRGVLMWNRDSPVSVV